MPDANDQSFVLLDPIASPVDIQQFSELDKLRHRMDDLERDVKHTFRIHRKMIECLEDKVKAMALTIKDLQDKATAVAATLAQVVAAVPAQSAIDAVGKTLDDAQAAGQAALNPSAPTP